MAERAEGETRAKATGTRGSQGKRASGTPKAGGGDGQGNVCEAPLSDPLSSMIIDIFNLQPAFARGGETRKERR